MQNARMAVRFPGFVLNVLLCGGLMSNLTWAADPPEHASPQRKCPIMPEEDIDPDIYVDHAGTRVFFCCMKCKNKFRSDPENYFKLVAQVTPVPTLAAAPVSATQPSETAAAASVEEDAAGSRWLLRIGRFHVPLTDFPVGVLIAAATAELLFMRTSKPLFDSGARYCVWFAAISALITVPLGWCLAGFEPLKDDWLLATHRWLGTGSALLLLLILWTSERARRVTPASSADWKRYRLLLFSGTLCVIVTGFFGGAMVWGIDHYWK